MMKKRIVLVLLAFFLVGCASVVPETPEPETPKSDPVTPEVDTSDKKDDSETVADNSDKNDTSETADSNVDKPADTATNSMSRNEYIRATFVEHGFTTPAESQWIVKEEGPQKIAVIIKENVSRGKPNISKLIFLEGSTNQILFLQINNRVIIKG